MKPLIDQLQQILRQQIQVNRDLTDVFQQKIQALGAAQPKAVAGLSEQENRLVQVLSELEKDRQALVADLTLALEPTSRKPMTLPELAQRIAEPDRGSLLMLRQQLRQEMESGRRQAMVAGQISQNLVRHMQGLVQTITAAVNGLTTYTRQGRSPVPVAAVSTFSATA